MILIIYNQLCLAAYEAKLISQSVYLIKDINQLTYFAYFILLESISNERQARVEIFKLKVFLKSKYRNKK